ncbi:hypothetical protein RJ639_043446 [Escallonia herrerae]|uniref:Uncharacterized protein n=1 Tax=Escallonia herrerae TaxID=1293975 RepID=A0AA88WD13_9ASTE|nr:hypothetical protein RJ639_043446 [Escallonia herrerae]
MNGQAATQCHPSFGFFLTSFPFIQVLCLIATWVEDPNSEAYKRHLGRIPDYFWLAEDGMKLQVAVIPLQA